MSETRRNIFKTSILSVFGLMTGSAILRAAAAPATATADPQNIDVHVKTTSTDPTKQWIVFQPTGSGTFTGYYFTPTSVPTDPRMEWDSQQIASNPSLLTLVTDNQVGIAGTNPLVTLTINQTPPNQGTITQSALFPLGVKQFTWNEIGTQHSISTTGGLGKGNKPH